jgi:Asp-tRNA(Asn)/Glu-tRNA(Gln) amidotransferase A subunit family amidase
MARSASDLHLLFNALAKDSSDKSLDQRRGLIKGWRVSWYVDDGVSPVTDETKQAVEAAARALADAGLIIEGTRPPAVERGHELWLKLFSRGSVVQLRNVYAGHDEKAGEFVRWRLATADNDPAPTLDDYINSWLERDRLRAKLVRWMDQTPLILAPVGATPALPHDTHKVTVGGQTLSTFRAFSYSQTYNVFDLPAVVIPVGRSAEGLPIGVQIIGRPFDEENVLAAAAIIEEALS